LDRYELKFFNVLEYSLTKFFAVVPFSTPFLDQSILWPTFHHNMQQQHCATAPYATNTPYTTNPQFHTLHHTVVSHVVFCITITYPNIYLKDLRLGVYYRSGLTKGKNEIQLLAYLYNSTLLIYPWYSVLWPVRLAWQSHVVALL